MEVQTRLQHVQVEAAARVERVQSEAETMMQHVQTEAEARVEEVTVALHESQAGAYTRPLLSPT